jgi:hypothetical protein
MILPPSISKHHEELKQKYAESPDNKHTIDECLKTFSMYSKTARTNLSHYFLLHWTSEYFLDSLDGPDKSYITKDGIRYYVIYQEFLSPEYITAYENVRLSFRKPHFLEAGFVLVRSVKEIAKNTRTGHLTTGAE